LPPVTPFGGYNYLYLRDSVLKDNLLIKRIETPAIKALGDRELWKLLFTGIPCH
jgi:hypothetical protein